ncbi:hypothetical protein [Sphingopyxis sp. PET50]|nr:hypothetical protein [Sphingopyxis sp. PET50]
MAEARIFDRLKADHDRHRELLDRIDEEEPKEKAKAAAEEPSSEGARE